jgi:hypothetical protein
MDYKKYLPNGRAIDNTFDHSFHAQRKVDKLRKHTYF